jgi:TonB-dependent starch-binding outer membrane protein SusC
MKKSRKESKQLLRIVTWVFILLCVNTMGVFAQLKVGGTVLDNNKEPLIGVNVKVVGTKLGTITDVNGKYSIQVTDNKSVLAFSYIGYKSELKTVGNNTQINVTMAEDAKTMDEVVVVAYGTQQKSHLTGAVSSLKNDKLDEIPVSRVDQALQGKLAGVNIQQLDPEAGEAPVIRVRGMGSISAAVTPLVVVDGFPIPDGLSSLSMADIESIEVLKDAASASMYGSRAAGGVILVTTKSGNITKPKYNFKMYSGIRNILKLPDLYDQIGYNQLMYDEAALRMQDPAVDGYAQTTANPTGTMTYNQIAAADKGGYLVQKYLLDQPTNWLNEALRGNGSNQNYTLSASGGDKNLKYYISGNYNREEGVMRYSNYDKYNLRAKIDVNLSKVVTIGVNLAPTYSRQTKPASGLIDFIRYPSWLPVRNNAAIAALNGTNVGDYAQAGDFISTTISGIGLNNEPWFVQGVSLSGSSNQNPTSVNERTSITTDDYRLQTNAYMIINIMPGLQFKTSNGVYTQYKEYNNSQMVSATKSNSPNSLTRQTTLHTELLTENTLNYTKKFGNHDITALIGATYQQTGNRFNQIVATGFPNDQMFSFNLASALIMDSPNASPSINGVISYYYTEAMESFIGRLIYAYQGKYLFSASVRADGSSKFAAGHKWGTFPAGSLGWRVSEEKFLKQFDWLSNLKLRASYGLTGNNNIPQYSYMNSYNTSNYVTGSGNGNLIPGVAGTDNFIGNPNITWEQTEEGNYGIDLGLFNSRVNLTVEYYNSNTIQLLLQQPIMYITGHQTFWNNIGKVNNQGLEFELTTTNIDSHGFTWKTTANLATNKNKLLNYGSSDPGTYVDNFGERSEVYRAEVGMPSIQYYGYVQEGVWTSWAEVAAAKAALNKAGTLATYTKFAPAVGAEKVKDLNGDGNISPDDRTFIGSPFPDFTYGITNTFSFVGFDFSFLITGSQGGKLIDGNMNYNESLRVTKAYLANRWVSPAFPGDGMTTYDKNTSGGDLLLTSHGLQDASHAALKDCTLGYKFPDKVIKSLGLSQLRLYASAENLIYLMGTDYKGINPEARMTSGPYSSAFPLVDGYQRGAFPLNRTFTVGVDINF